MGTRVQSVVGSLKTLAVGLGVAFAVRELASFVSSVIAADANLGDLSKKVGVSVEALSALQNAAKQSGTDISAVQSAFVKLAQAATDGSSKGAKALAAMSIALKDSNGNLKSSQQLFDEAAAKFATYQDGAEKAALAVALFGKSGTDLIPLLNQVGQQGLGPFIDQAKAAGVVTGEDAVRAAQAWQKALAQLQDKLAGVVNQGLAQFTPSIQQLAEKLEDPAFNKALRDTGDGIIAIANAAIQASEKLVLFISHMQDVVGFQLDEHVGGEQSNDAAIKKLDELKAQQQARKNGTVKLTSSDLTLGFGKTTPAFMSDADLAKEIAKLESETAAYRRQSAVAAKLAADKKALAEANADPSLHVSQEGQNRAPVIPDSTARDAAAAAAAKLAQQAAAAQQQLTQSLIDLQSQLDPTAAIYAKFNDTVKKATDEAELAKKANGANAQAIDTQRDAVVALAGKVRDAALDQLAEKDRQAWEALKRSFETPAQVRVEDALKQIQQLNDMLAKGVITAQQYHDALGQIGQKSVAGALPQYQGVGAAVGGPYGELQKNYQAQTALDTAYQAQKLALDQKFNDQEEAQHAAHVAALAKLDADYKDQSTKIEQARGTLQLQAASNLFGQLATLSSSHNKKIAAIGKAAAIAQTIIQTYQSATEAYAAMASIPYIGPALGAAAAAVAIAAGLANVAQIRSQNVGGYAQGGPIRGPGTATSDSFLIRASNREFMQPVSAVDYYGQDFMEAVRTRQFPRYAEGGLVSPFANAPTPAQLGFTSPSMPRADFSKLAVAKDDAHARQPLTIRNVLVMDPDVVPSAMAGQRGERVTMTHIKANIPTVRAWINGKK